MRARLAPSRSLALLFVGALAAVLGVVLLSESARVPIRTPLVPRAARGEPLAIPLEGRESRRGGFSFRLALRMHDTAALAAHDELWLFLSSPERGRALLGAEIRVRGSRLRAQGGARRRAISVERPLVLQRSPACLEAGALPLEADLDLAVETRGGAPLFLLGFRPQPGAAPATIQAPPLGARSSAADVRGHLVFYPPTAPRVTLLNQMWRLSAGSLRPVALACLGVGAALAGCLVFPTRPRPGGSVAAGPVVRRTGTGAGLFALSLALLHAALAPPLSAPDEPYHMLGFAELGGRSRTRARHGGVDGGDAPLADPPPAGRALSHDRRRPSVRRGRSRAAADRGRDAQRGAGAAVARGRPGARRKAGAFRAARAAAAQFRPLRARGRCRGRSRRRDAGRALPAVARVRVPVRAVAAVLRDARVGDGASVLDLRAARSGHRGAVPGRPARLVGRAADRDRHGADAGRGPLALAAHGARRSGARGPRPARAARGRGEREARRPHFLGRARPGRACLLPGAG